MGKSGGAVALPASASPSPRSLFETASQKERMTNRRAQFNWGHHAFSIFGLPSSHPYPPPLPTSTSSWHIDNAHNSCQRSINLDIFVSLKPFTQTYPRKTKPKNVKSSYRFIDGQVRKNNPNISAYQSVKSVSRSIVESFSQSVSH